MFGVMGEGSFGRIWLLGSDELVSGRTGFQFLRQSRWYLRDIAAPYKTIGNFIDARNDKHIQWLLRLGFDIVTKIERFGAEQRPFLEFRLSCASL